MDAGPALVSIMRQGPNLIASIQTALDDTQMIRFQRDLIDQVGQHRSRGIIIDVAALDVLDSFGSHTLRKIAEMAANPRQSRGFAFDSFGKTRSCPGIATR